MHIIKLKTILQSKYLYYALLVITLIYVLINTLIIKKESLYNFNDNNFILKIINIKENDYGKTITFSGKEDLISFYNDDFPYQLGDIVLIKGSLSIPSKNTIPNLFNYQEYLYNQGIFYLLEIEDIELISFNQNLLYKIKSFLINHINNYKSKCYLHAFILGNTSYIDDDIRNYYQILGISHLFAISGMHVSLLISLISFILNKLKLNKYLVFILITTFLIIYVFLVNFQVSIIRSVLSYILLSCNKFFKLSIKSEYILIFILSIVLLYNPFNIYNLGFQYSYLISFVLIKYNVLIKGSYIKKMFLVSFLAFFSSIPITLINNYEINLLTVFYNLIYVPLVSIIIFPCSLITLCVPLMDTIFNYLINFLEEITLIFKDITCLLIFKKINISLMLIYFGLILFILNGLIKRKYSRFIWIIILMFIHYHFNFFFNESYLISFDVSQGDSLLIHYNDKNILIDTGGSIYNNYSSDIVEFFKSAGIRKLNYLVLTHGDFDHMGEAIDLVNKFKVEKVIFNCGEFNELEQDLIKVLDKNKISYYSCIKELNVDSNKLYFLNNKDYDNENDNSSVIYAELNNHKFLFMGDAGVDVEKDLIQKYNLKNIDVLKVGHHGSKTSSGKEFVNELNPKYSVISVGKNNRYGHPNDSVLDNLENSKIYRTDEDGSIMFKIKNEKLKIETCAP